MRFREDAASCKDQSKMESCRSQLSQLTASLPYDTVSPRPEQSPCASCLIFFTLVVTQLSSPSGSFPFRYIFFPSPRLSSYHLVSSRTFSGLFSSFFWLEPHLLYRLLGLSSAALWRGCWFLLNQNIKYLQQRCNEVTESSEIEGQILSLYLLSVRYKAKVDLFIPSKEKATTEMRKIQKSML